MCTFVFKPVPPLGGVWDQKERWEAMPKEPLVRFENFQ